MNILSRLLRTYMRSSLRGSTRVPEVLARKINFFHCCLAEIDDLSVYLDLRQATAKDWLRIGTLEEWEAGERAIMRHYVAQGDTVYDIGANIGLHTAYLSKLVGAQGHIFAFEPNTLLHPTLSMTCRVLGNAELFPYALSEEQGQCKFYTPADHTMASLNNWTGLEIIESVVEVRRLIDLKLPAPDFIKCDVEGNELNVFSGAREMLDCETAPIILYEANRQSAEISASTHYLSKLTMARYSFYVVCDNGSLRELTEWDFAHANLLAVPALRRNHA